MKLDSVRSYNAEKAELAASSEAPEAFFAALGLPREPALSRRFFAGGPRAMVPGVALGLAPGEELDDYRVAVRVATEELAAPFRAELGSEADIRVVQVSARGPWTRDRRRPMESGLSIGLANESAAGTLGGFVRENGTGRLLLLSNSHVIANVGRAKIGTPIVQPSKIDGIMDAGSYVGVLDRAIPIEASRPNLVDCAVGTVEDVAVMSAFSAAVQKNIRGGRDLVPTDLGRSFFKGGRTSVLTEGFLTALEVDGLPVAYDGFVPRFNDQYEFSGGVGNDFSAPGDSGSFILDWQGFVVALLFAGGKDNTGEDFTYGNRITNVLAALGVSLVTG